MGYVADICAANLKLVIEVDGDDHAARNAADRQRTVVLERKGFRILRFGNADVINVLDGVLEAILILAHIIPSPSPAGKRGQ